MGDLNAEILEGHYSSALCHLGQISYRVGDKASATKVVVAAEAFEMAAPLPAGTLVSDHVNVSGSPSASLAAIVKLTLLLSSAV